MKGFTHIQSHTFQNKRYRIIWRRPDKGHDGDCDSPDTVGKVIRIGVKQSQYDLLETVVHEGFHAAFFNVDEPHVTRGAEDIARLLWRMGFRLR